MAKPDLTYLAVRRQLQGMGTDKYEVGIRDAHTGKMLPRVWSRQEVLKSVTWLKRQNSSGADIYIRPEGSQGLILMDDLEQGTITRMQAEGIAPAAIIETSPLNFQAWIRVSLTPIAAELATAVAKDLARRYNADANSADWRHYGRLAGFTNRKPVYAGASGRYPYVKAHGCNGKLAENAAHLLSGAANTLSATQLRKKQQHPSQGLENVVKQHSSIAPSPPLDPVVYYQRDLAVLMREYGTDMDESRADWMIAKHMAMRGYAPTAIQQALTEASPNLDHRKRGHVDDYVERTVTNVLRDIEVIEARKARTAQLAFEFEAKLR